MRPQYGGYDQVRPYPVERPTEPDAPGEWQWGSRHHLVAGREHRQISALHFTYSKLARNGATLPATPVDGSVSTTAPTSPTLSIVRLNVTTARLSWTVSSGVAEYQLYRDAVPYFTPGDPSYQTTTGSRR